MEIFAWLPEYRSENEWAGPYFESWMEAKHEKVDQKFETDTPTISTKPYKSTALSTSKF